MSIQASFQEFVDGLQTARSKTSFANVASRVIQHLGFEWFAYLRLGQHAPLLVSSYPRTWTDRYFALSYQNLDPVVLRAAREQDVFGWGEGGKPAGTAEQRRFFEEATTFGIRSGITVPIQGGFGDIAAFTLASAEPMAIIERLGAERKATIRLVGLYFHAHLTARLDNPVAMIDKVALTQRELQCLAWTARGKTVADVAVLVGIKPRTVVFHLENARRKLHASSIAQCVASALRGGLLS